MGGTPHGRHRQQMMTNSEDQNCFPPHPRTLKNVSAFWTAHGLEQWEKLPFLAQLLNDLTTVPSLGSEIRITLSPEQRFYTSVHIVDSRHKHLRSVHL